jgi:signal transduction histidine kinase
LTHGGLSLLGYHGFSVLLRQMAMKSLVKPLLVAIVCLLTQVSAVAAEHKRVMILHSFGREFRPWNEYARAIRAELDRQSPWVLDVQEHSLVAARTTDRNPDQPFVDYLQALNADMPPDLIVCIGAPAAIFIQRNRKQLFPTAPMIFTAVEQRRIQFANLTEYDTVVAVRHDFRFLFESFLQISPQTRVVAMVNGNSPNELVWQEEMRRELKPLEPRIEIRWYNTLPFDEILKRIAALPEHSAIFWFQMTIDGAGVGHEGETALRQVYAVANAPIFTTDEAFFGREIIGGPMHSPIELGRRAASVAVRILGGETPGNLKTPPSDFQAPKYDERELRRWNISERLLPVGAEVDFREPTVWETYRWQILLIVTVILAQGALIAGLLHEHRRRAFAEVQASRRTAELAHVNRFAMAGELTTSIAHEINQPLGAILANIETAELMLDSQTPDLKEVREILSDIHRDNQRATEVIRRLRSLLKKAPFELKDLDLNNLVGETVDLLSRVAAGREVNFASSPASGSLPIKGDRVQLQQVIVNLVVNAMDAMSAVPSGQRVVSIRTERIDNFAQISVSDGGPGIPPEKLKEVFEPFFTTKPQGMGMGLSIARTIVEAHCGQLLAENRARGGAVFHIRLPLAALAE